MSTRTTTRNPPTISTDRLRTIPRSALAAATMFNYFLSWKAGPRGENRIFHLDAVDVWHIISIFFVFASCAEEPY